MGRERGVGTLPAGLRAPLVQRILSGAIWSAVGASAATGINLITFLLLARELGKESYGHFIAVQTTLSTVGTLSGFGIGSAATRYVAELKGRDSARLCGILVLSQRLLFALGIFGSITLALSAEWLASSVLDAPDLRLPLILAAASVLFSALDAYQKSVLIGFEAMRPLAIATVAGALCGVPAILLAAHFSGVDGAAAGIAAASIFQWAISRGAVRREVAEAFAHHKGLKRRNEWPVIWKFALPAFIAGALIGPTHWCVQVILANSPGSFAEVATLGIAMQWFSLILFLPNTTGRVILPILTERIASDDSGGARRVLLYSMIANAIVAAPIAVTAALLSPYVAGLYGRDFANSHVAISLAVLIAALVATVTPTGNMLAATARMWIGAIMNAGWAAIYLLGAYLLADRGAVGALYALLIGYVFHAAWTFGFTFRYLSR